MIEENAQFDEVCEAVAARAHVLVTGEAGTGKSTLLKRVVAQERARGRNVRVAALTASAALLVKGTTLHKFAGVGLARESAAELAARAKRNNRTRSRLQRTDLLVIDEISMCSAELLDKVSTVVERCRVAFPGPFGGMQVVFFGDFFQLSPVRAGGARGPAGERAPVYAFESAAWREMQPLVVQLRTNYRQRTDPAFTAILREARAGALSAASAEALAARVGVRAPPATPAFYPTNAAADAHNARSLAALEGDSATFRAREEFFAVAGGTKDHLAQLIKSVPAPAELELKVGALVILVRNLAEDEDAAPPARRESEDFEPRPPARGAGLVNGAVGIVRALGGSAPQGPPGSAPQDPPGPAAGRAPQDRLGPAAKEGPAAGSAVADEFAAVLEAAAAAGATPAQVAAMRAALGAEGAGAPGAGSSSGPAPAGARAGRSPPPAVASGPATILVDFGGDIGTVAIAPSVWALSEREAFGEGSSDRAVAAFTQFPLRLAYALTIHRSQGMTLCRASARLGAEVFATGQAYVLLSRVRRLEDLYLTEFEPGAIFADPVVVEAYEAWDAAEDAGPSGS